MKLRHRFWLLASDVAYFVGAWNSRGLRWRLYLYAIYRAGECEHERLMTESDQ